LTIGANSYGSTGDVAALTPRYANGSAIFDATTRPTLTTVEAQVNQVSALANSILAQAGFVTPISQADAKLALDIFVNEEVAAIVEGINGSGRFGPTTKEPGRSRFALITDALKSFVQANKQGFVNLGVPIFTSEVDSLTAGVIALDFADHNEDVY